MGGLGNQLFQIFTTISYAMIYSKPFFFLDNEQIGNGEKGGTIRFTYWNTFLSGLKAFLKNEQQIPQLITIKEQQFRYEPIPENFTPGYGVVLVGFYQSPLYFNRYKDLIYKMIKIDSRKILIMETEKIKNKIIFNKTISIHFRLGDYKKYPNKHPILSVDYYKNAISYILNEEIDFNEECKTNNILYFCEEEDIKEVEEIVQQLTQIFSFSSLIFKRANPLLKDWEQLLLMSGCKHNIIANSSFSWWAAYLNNNHCKIVCYPEKWFGSDIKNDTSDMFPDDWTAIPSM